MGASNANGQLMQLTRHIDNVSTFEIQPNGYLVADFDLTGVVPLGGTTDKSAPFSMTFVEDYSAPHHPFICSMVVQASGDCNLACDATVDVLGPHHDKVYTFQYFDLCPNCDASHPNHTCAFFGNHKKPLPSTDCKHLELIAEAI